MYLEIVGLLYEYNICPLLLNENLVVWKMKRGLALLVATLCYFCTYAQEANANSNAPEFIVTPRFDVNPYAPVKGGKPTITVPCGFQSDGASVPRAFWRLIFPKGDEKALRAAIIHDWIYRTHPAGWTKAEADKLFYELLKADGVPTWRAWLAYQGVKWFGHIAWNTRGEW